MFQAPHALREKAETLAQQGKWADAAHAWRRLVARHPTDMGARQHLAQALTRTGDTDGAVDQYACVAGQYAVDGMLLKAMAVCKTILTLRPQDAKTQAMLADLVAQKEDVRSGPVAVAVAVKPPTEPSDEAVSGELIWSVLNPEPQDSQDRTVVGQAPSGPGGDAAAAPAPSAPTPAPAAMQPDRSLSGATPVPMDEDASSEALLVRSVELELDPATLPPIALFSSLRREEFLEVFACLKLASAAAGDLILREGDMGDSMYVLVQGRAAVERKVRGRPERVASLEEGAFFGEMAVLANAPRLAGVVALTDCVLLQLARSDLDKLAQRFPSVAKAVEHHFRTRLMHNVLRASPLFRQLSTQDVAVVTAACRLEHVPSGTELVRQGRKADALRLVLRGRCRVRVREASGEVKEDLPDMKEGDVFGEISLALDTPATATVTASTGCVLLVLEEKAFNKVFRNNVAAARQLEKLGEARLARMGIETELDLDS